MSNFFLLTHKNIYILNKILFIHDEFSFLTGELFHERFLVNSEVSFS